MYNGIGLRTPRGSGTSGYVQKNLAHVKKSKQVRPDIVAKPDDVIDRKPNSELILHQKKREIEAKCFNLRAELEEEGMDSKKIDIEVNKYRQRKLDELQSL